MENPIIYVPYDNYTELIKAKGQRDAVLDIMKAQFADDACRLTALKAVLEIEEPKGV